MFKGEHACGARFKDGRPCTHQAYYAVAGEPRCGVHSKRVADRVTLPVNPDTAIREAEDARTHRMLVEAVAQRNYDSGVPGRVALHKLVGGFASKAPRRPGWLTVLPNYRNRTGAVRNDGALSMGDLSPMRVGPIYHGQPGVHSPAKNLENFHQGSKKFAAEDAAAFKRTQTRMFNDATPHRHHPCAVRPAPGRPRAVPEHFVWVSRDAHGYPVTNRLGYVESRQFYCNFYERAVKDSFCMRALRKRMADGYDLLLCGYDAYEPTDAIEAHYLDPTRPFGHELVLYTMLTHPEAEWPWRKHKTFDF